MIRAATPSRAAAPGRLVAAALLLALLVPAAPAGAADAFYERLLRDGVHELERGDLELAERDLRLAAFGFLGEPELLAECLVHLALVRREQGDEAGFRRTFERLLEVENRFGAYRAATLSPETRRAFEQASAEALPPEVLDRAEVFRPLAKQRYEAEISALPTEPRRRRLEALIADDPDELRWRLLLARLELDDRRTERAIAVADELLQRAPDNAGAFCVRGLALVRLDRCPAAVDDLTRCDRTPLDLPVAYAMLACLSELERWQEAADWLATVAPAVRADGSIVRLQRRVNRRLPSGDGAPSGGGAATGSEAAAAGGESAAGSDAATPTTDAPPPPAPPVEVVPALTPEDASTLRRARALLARARTTADLGEAAELAGGVADRNPDSTAAQLLAAEIAYRSRRWETAARYFRRAGDPTALGAELQFYLAVSLYESGEPGAARQAMESALPRLTRTEFVESYAEKILGTAAASPER